MKKPLNLRSNSFHFIAKQFIIHICLLLITQSCTKDELIESSNNQTIGLIIKTDDSISENRFKKLPPHKIEEILNKDKKEISSNILILINNYRNEKGKQSLISSETAKIEAIRHSQHQAKRNHISHKNHIVRASVIFEIENATFYSENVAFGYYDMEKLVRAWCDSGKHRKILEWEFTHTGIGTVSNEKGVLYFTQIFYK